MSWAIMDDASEYPTVTLTAALLARVQALNLDYLELLVADCRRKPCTGQARRLPAQLHALIRDLPHAACERLAALPFALYSLRFDDKSSWEQICRQARRTAADVPVMQRYARFRTGATHAFCEVALLHAWHVAASNPLGARLVYAMPQAIAARLAQLTIWQVRHLAEEHLDLLAPGWPSHPVFWPDLLHFAHTGDQVRLSAAKLLGTQLIAATFSPSGPAGRRGAACRGRRG